MAIVCDHCRAENPDGSLYCANCGWQLVPPEDDEQYRPPAVARRVPPPRETPREVRPQVLPDLEQQEVEIRREEAAESPAELTQPGVEVLIEEAAELPAELTRPGVEVVVEEPARPARAVSTPPEPELTIVDGTVVIGERSYALADIASVSMVTEPASRLPSMVLAVFGLLIAAVGVGILPRELLFGILLGVGGVLLAAIGVLLSVTAQKQYTLRLETDAGTEDALISPDESLVSDTVDALRRALAEQRSGSSFRGVP